jgi:hypothetical protein
MREFVVCVCELLRSELRKIWKEKKNALNIYTLKWSTYTYFSKIMLRIVYFKLYTMVVKSAVKYDSYAHLWNGRIQ